MTATQDLWAHRIACRIRAVLVYETPTEIRAIAAEIASKTTDK